MTKMTYAKHEVEITVADKKRTRLHQRIGNGNGNAKPEIEPTDPRVTRKVGEKLRVSAVSMPAFSTEHMDGRFQGANGKWYYAVNDDAVNGDAANLFVLLSEVTILRSGFLYTVKSGDTLSKIAREYDSQIPGLSQKIYETNKEVIGENPNMIHPGQELFIPNK